MSFSKSKTYDSKANLFVSFLKGLIVSMLVSFALIILLAFSLKWFSLNEKFISPLNLLIKTISVLIGSIIAIKGESKGLVKGIVFGFLYVALAFSSFSFLANSFVFDLSLLLDIVFACVAGGTVGVIKVNR
ncbi:MAG: TIGR04086 family membrane protein [Clostridia bacterium]|nr:TIGR04086 family membrane protein [Clostridia bacterium]